MEFHQFQLFLQYKCQYCDRAFAQSNDLVKHTRSHVGVNTYKCDQCTAAFRLHGELRIHRQQHFLEQKGIMADQSSQESFDQKVTEMNKKDVKNDDEFQTTLRDLAKNDVHFEMLQIETSSQPQIFTTDKQQQTPNPNFMTHN